MGTHAHTFSCRDSKYISAFVKLIVPDEWKIFIPGISLAYMDGIIDKNNNIIFSEP